MVTRKQRTRAKSVELWTLGKSEKGRQRAAAQTFEDAAWQLERVSLHPEWVPSRVRPRPRGWGASQPPARAAAAGWGGPCARGRNCRLDSAAASGKIGRIVVCPGSCQMPAGSRDEAGSFSLLWLSVYLQHPVLMEPTGPCLTKQAVKDVFRSMVHGKGLWARAKPSSLASLYSASIHMFLTHLSFHITNQTKT